MMIRRALVILLFLLAGALLLFAPVLAADDDDDFFSFGPPSTKGNDIHRSGYDPARDWVNAGGGVTIGTARDTPNIWGQRQEFESTPTNFKGRTTLFRIGGIPIDKDGDYVFDNGSDGEVVNTAYIMNDGHDPAKMYSEFWIGVVDSRDPKKVVGGPMLKFSGKDGGSVTFEGRNRDGTKTTKVLAKAS